MSRSAHIAAILLIFVLAGIPAAWAYDETGATTDPGNCAVCHNGSDQVDVGGVGAARQGPHGGYSTTSRNCEICHRVHAAEGELLYPRGTVTETCGLCHDGTGGSGVYGVLEARGLTVAASHRTETTNTVPGGNPVTGLDAPGPFTGAEGTLSCGDCHSPHGANTVDSYTTDRSRTPTDTTGFVSNELLRKLPSGATTETTKFGSDWCGGCHKARLNVHDIINHPVDSGSGPGSFNYDNVQVLNGVDTSVTASGTLGRSNFGYVMPYPRTAGQGSHKPICQQCHEDARNVGDVASGTVSPSEQFTVTSSDGTNASDNPRFQVFPHESANSGLLVETGDDLCTNCHPAKQLP